MRSARVRATYHHGDLAATARRAALALINERGSPDFSLRELAARIGVAHAALYAHYRSKAALLQTLAIDGLDDLRMRQQAARAGATGGVLAELRAIADAYIAFADAEPAAYRLIFNTDHAVLDAAPMAAARVRATALLFELIRDACAKGLMRGADEEVLAVALWSAAHGLAHLIVSGHIDEMPRAAAARETALRTALDIAIRGTLTPRGLREFARLPST